MYFLRVFQQAFLKIGICMVLQISGERHVPLDFDWLDWASWEAA
jgi:hypothetical protein